MSYEALVCRLQNVRKHSNADRVKLANVSGYQVIVGLNAKDGDLGVFFGPDGKLSREHLLNNNLYQVHPDTGKKIGGYFGKNGRVKAQKFRGEISEGFWQEVSAFAWCNDKLLKEGDTFIELNGHKICEKYYTPATIRMMNKQSNKLKLKGVYRRFQKAPWYRKSYLVFWVLYMILKEKLGITEKKNYSNFAEHYDTKQLRDYVNSIPEESLIYISEKCHGTSGRTGYVFVTTTLTGFLGWFVSKFKKPEWQYLSGTRRTVMKESKPDGWYVGTDFRKDIHKIIASSGLHKGETLYYEIVGYTDTGGSIMGKLGLEDKIDKDGKITDLSKLRKLFGENVTFSYGCNANENGYPHQYNILVYRITITNEDGNVTELSWEQVEARCDRLGLQTVPVLKKMFYSNPESLLNNCKLLADGKSTLDTRHIREGVVVRIEDKDMTIAVKYKGFHFCTLENIRKNDDEYVDFEEIS